MASRGQPFSSLASSGGDAMACPKPPESVSYEFSEASQLKSSNDLNRQQRWWLVLSWSFTTNIEQMVITSRIKPPLKPRHLELSSRKHKFPLTLIPRPLACRALPPQAAWPVKVKSPSWKFSDLLDLPRRRLSISTLRQKSNQVP